MGFLWRLLVGVKDRVLGWIPNRIKPGPKTSSGLQLGYGLVILLVLVWGARCTLKDETTQAWLNPVLSLVRPLGTPVKAAWNWVSSTDAAAIEVVSTKVDDNDRATKAELAEIKAQLAELLKRFNDQNQKK